MPKSFPASNLLTILFLLLAPSWGLATPTRPGALSVSKETTYRVTITTSFEFPKKCPYDRVQVQHALPIEKPWNKGQRRTGAKAISYEPRKGRVQIDAKTKSATILWEEYIPPSGKTMTFQTTYETTSVFRELSPEAKEKARWRGRRIQDSPDLPDELKEIAKTLIQEPTPLEALTKFSHWLTGRIRFNGFVSPKNSQEVLDIGEGHCGHFALVFRAFCHTVGLETRLVGGKNLRHPDGGIDNVWGNSHAWVEVDIPGLGWIEVEPAGRDNLFVIPPRCIQTLVEFQNFEAKVLENGKWVYPPRILATRPDGTTYFTNSVNMKNIITFEIL